MENSELQSDVSQIMGRRRMLFGSAITLGGLAVGIPNARSAATEEISHNAETIHHEVSFKAPRARVYDVLTDAAKFHKVVLLSKAATTGMVPIKSPAEISRELGGTFALFGGYITGRQIELIAGQRIVQAWRVGSWAPGLYSIARFELAEDGAGTKLTFDHTGFPVGDAEHLAEGWKGNYWEPIAKFLAQ